MENKKQTCVAFESSSLVNSRDDTSRCSALPQLFHRLSSTWKISSRESTKEINNLTLNANTTTCGSRWLSRFFSDNKHCFAPFEPSDVARSQIFIINDQFSVVHVSAVAFSEININSLSKFAPYQSLHRMANCCLRKSAY